jgi:hypothetical protein
MTRAQHLYESCYRGFLCLVIGFSLGATINMLISGNRDPAVADLGLAQSQP